MNTMGHTRCRSVEHLFAPGRTEIMTTTNTNPIDHAIVALLFTFEGLCWIINELAGFHAATKEVIDTDLDPRETFAVEVSAPVVTVETAPIETTFDGLNVKQLRALAREVGIQSINKLRKTELIAALS